MADWRALRRIRRPLYRYIDPDGKAPPLLYVFVHCLSGPSGTSATPTTHEVTYRQSDPLTANRLTPPYQFVFSTQTPSCPSGSALAAGGFGIVPRRANSLLPSDPYTVWVSASQPTADNAWQITTTIGRTTDDQQITAYAVCVAGLTATLGEPASLEFKGTDFADRERVCGYSNNPTPAPTDYCNFYHVLRAKTPACPAGTAVTAGAFELSANSVYAAQNNGPGIILSAPLSFGDPGNGIWSLAAQAQVDA